MIKFIGRRSKTNKHVGMFAAAEPVTASAASGSAKPLSVGAEVTYADLPADRWARLPFSEEEMETINQGTNEVADWKSIRLWITEFLLKVSVKYLTQPSTSLQYSCE